MRLVTFDAGQGPRLGGLVAGRIYDLADGSKGRLPSDMLSLLQRGEAGLAAAGEILGAVSGTNGYPEAEVKLLAPIPNPSKVIAIGLNYMDHCREQNIEPPKKPVIFTKFTTSIVGQGDVVAWNPELTSQVDYEVELAVVIGKAARNVAANRVYDYIAGYTVCNDVSARDLQFGDGQWVRGKSLDTFCPLGPYLVTKDEVPDPHNLKIRCTVNGQALQDSTTAEMIFKIPALVEFASHAFTLLPGDVLITGTPDGVGIFRKPKVLLKDGDVMTVEVEGLGQLTNTCQEVKG